MKTANNNSVLGVMSLFNNEAYYKYAIEVMWTLRSIGMKIIERHDGGSFYWDSKHPDYWIAEITNEFIGRALIDGYTYSTILGSIWYVSDPRGSESSFLTYGEAKFIAGIAEDDRLMAKLYRLRDSVSSYSDDESNPAHNIYKVVNDLIEALSGRKLLCA